MSADTQTSGLLIRKEQVVNALIIESLTNGNIAGLMRIAITLGIDELFDQRADEVKKFGEKWAIKE